MNRSRRFSGCMVGACLLVVGLFGFPPRAQAEGPAEYQVKAAFLYHFVQFMTWPPPAQGRAVHVICIIGQDPFGPVLDLSLAGKEIEGKPLTVKRIGAPADIDGCEALFVATSHEVWLRDIQPKIKGKPILTIAESGEFTASGGMVGFFLEGSKVHFEINLDALAQAGLTASSKLLRLAKITKP